MSRRSAVAILAVVVLIAVLWFGGQALWHALLEMHGRGRSFHNQ